MITLGIDPGTATSGYGLITEKNDRLVFVDHGVIKTSNKDDSHVRLKNIFAGFKELIVAYKPKHIAIEKLFFGVNTKTAMAVGQARGVLLLLAAQFGIQIAEYSPMEVKLAVTGYGKADKKQIQQMVKSLLRLDDIPKPDDAADALAIAICHQHSRKIRSL